MDHVNTINNTQNVIVRIGFYALLAFTFIRPFALVDLKIVILNQIFNAAFSYFFLLILAFSAREIMIERTGILIIIFSFYCVASITWGSQPKKVIELLLPFILFFSAMTFINRMDQVKHITLLYALGFILPLLFSTVFILLGLRVQMIEFWNKVPRHAGVYSGSHALAYQMLFYSYFFGFHRLIKGNQRNLNKYFFIGMLVLSIYCLYQSHTRTAIIGFLIFWIIHLYGLNKKSFYLLLIIGFFAAFVFQSQIGALFWKKSNEQDINRATSGRVGLWSDNIKIYLDLSLPEKILGQGLTDNPLIPYHNDYLSLIMGLGLVGLSLYLFILLNLLYDIFLTKEKMLKFFFLAVLISSCVMNFGSNAVISRFELSQCFWLLMGLFYVILYKNSISNKKLTDVEN